ncbi:FtsK/SpoIIIE domain-containing protein [Microbacterium sp. 13-71-7]|uniref:FtsK/SpoIIIE domain-containing protein n=1 Tax=Microbacterium sp. 13-71-7 TaxID=1970399 RepID=UPI0025E28017|nr:FtsK/SpoIIIE domain-containing protein [Microbacterium sp. 13-71-7]
MRSFVGFGLLGAVVAVGVLFTLLALDDALPFGVLYLLTPWLLLPVAVGAVAAAACLHGAFRETALQPWRDTVAARTAWDGRWALLKQPDMHMLTHEVVGPFTVDTFFAPPALGAAGAIGLHSKLPVIGTGMESASLTVPDRDSQGQEMPGTAHPSTFRVVTWASDADIDVTAADTAPDVIALRVETAVFLVASEYRAPAPNLIAVEPLPVGEGCGGAYAAELSGAVENAILNAMGVDGFADGRTLYFGDLDGVTDRSLLKLREKLEVTDRWGVRWRDVLKKDAKPPVLQYDHTQTAQFDARTTLTFQPFLYPQGLSLESYFEPYITNGLSSTLKAAPFVTLTGLTRGFVNGGLPGDRFPQGFAVIWSESSVPLSPAEFGAEVRDPRAAEWVLSGILNKAFDAAFSSTRKARPELVDAKCLTTRRSPLAVWSLKVRLFNGVTAAEVKSKQEVIRLAMGGVPWLRITEWDYGVEMLVGAVPRAESVQFASPVSLNRCDELDWEQGFLDNKLTAADGSAPRMLSIAPLESNPKVTRAEFTLPSPLSLAKVKEFIPKLRPATGNAYIDVMASDDATRMVIQFSETNPMPFPAPMLWAETLDTSTEVIPVASGIDGKTIGFNPKAIAHQLILGGSGSGKSSCLQVFLCGALVRADVIVIDTIKGGADFAFAKPWLKGFIGHNKLIAAGEVMMWVRAEMLRRAALNAAAGVGSYRDLPADVRPQHLYVFIDEFNQMMEPITVSKEPASSDPDVVAEWGTSNLEKQAQAKVAAAVKALTTGARSAGITLLLSGQSLKADLTKAHNLTGIKSNYARIALGKMSWGDLASAFKDSSALPDLGPSIPKGRGIWETDDDPAVAFQAWFAPGGQDEMRDRVAAVLPVLRPDEQLNIADFEAQVSAQTPVAFGQILDPDDEDLDDEVTELDPEALGLDLSFDFGSFDKADTAADSEADAAPFGDAPALADIPSFSERAGIEDELDASLAASFSRAPLDDAPSVPSLPAPDSEDDLFLRVSAAPAPGALLLGADIPVPEAAPVTGLPIADALVAYLRSRPEVEAVTFVDRVDAPYRVHDEDDIGVPFADTLQTALENIGVDFDIEDARSAETSDESLDGPFPADHAPTTSPEPDENDVAPLPSISAEPQRSEAPESTPLTRRTDEDPAAGPGSSSTHSGAPLGEQPVLSPAASDEDDWFMPPTTKGKPVIPDIDF